MPAQNCGRVPGNEMRHPPPSGSTPVALPIRPCENPLHPQRWSLIVRISVQKSRHSMSPNGQCSDWSAIAVAVPPLWWYARCC